MKPAAKTSLPVTAAMQTCAAEWLVRRNAGLGPVDAAGLDAWLAADARHRAAFAEAEATWSTLSFPTAVGKSGEATRLLNARARRRQRRRRFAGALAGAGLAVAVAAAFLFSPGRFALAPAPLASGVAIRPNLQTLPDGSTVELNADAEVAVDFSLERRAVRLIRGEALFAVKQDAARAFVVSAAGVTVRAVGTVFSVRHETGQVGVLVTEGQVAVRRVEPVAAPAGLVPEPVLVAAGGRVVLPADAANGPSITATRLSAAEIADALAWRGRRVEFTRTTIAEVVALFNGQNRVQIAIVDPAIGRIAISGTFWADDPEGFVRLLEPGFNVQAQRAGDVIKLRR